MKTSSGPVRCHLSCDLLITLTPGDGGNHVAVLPSTLGGK